MRHFYLLIRNAKLTLSSNSNSLPFWSVHVIIVSSNLMLQVSTGTKSLGSTFKKLAQDLLGVKYLRLLLILIICYITLD